MEIAQLIAFNVALLAAILSPGPAFVYAVRATLSGGRAAGLATGWGLGVMAATWTLLAFLGLDGLLRLFPWAYMAVKLAGAGYLIYLAWAIWRSAGTPVEAARAPRTRAFIGGILVNLANPKSVLFAGAVLVVIFPIDISLAHKMIVVANHLAVEIIVYSIFAFALGSAQVSARYLRLKPVFDRLAALALGALGLKLLAGR